MLKQWIRGYNPETDNLEYNFLIHEWQVEPEFGLGGCFPLTWEVASAFLGQQLSIGCDYFLETDARELKESA